MTRTTYRVIAQREGRWWLLRLPELDLATQTRRLARAGQTARDLIATWLDVDPASFDVEIVPLVGDERVERLIQQTVEVRSEAERAAEHARTLTNDAVSRLIERGVPLRDVGEILGLSHQRVAQLAAGRQARA